MIEYGLAMITGKGKYLLPQLEPSPQCSHKKVTHGANRLSSFQKCLQRGQEQKMPSTPLQDLHRWNTNLVYMQEDFYKRLVNKAVIKKKEEQQTAVSCNQWAEDSHQVQGQTQDGSIGEGRDEFGGGRGTGTGQFLQPGGLHWLGRCGDGGAHTSSASTELRCLPPRSGHFAPACPDPAIDAEAQSSGLPVLSSRGAGQSRGSPGSFSLSAMSDWRDGSDQRHGEPRGDGFNV